MSEQGPIRSLEYSERRRWGICPVCQAGHGEGCHPEVGMRLGSMSEAAAAEGVHLARLQNAPLRVREVPA